MCLAVELLTSVVGHDQVTSNRLLSRVQKSALIVVLAVFDVYIPMILNAVVFVLLPCILMCAFVCVCVYVCAHACMCV